MLMKVMKLLLPDQLGIWIFPAIWLNIVAILVDWLGLVDVDHDRLNFLILLSYAACVLFSGVTWRRQ